MVPDGFSQQGSSYIKWDPKFEIGIQIIDEQHKMLVHLCSELYNAIMANGNGNENWQKSLSSTLKTCVNYVQVHFSTEERLMKASGYKNFEEHKKQHEEFTRKVLQTASTYEQWHINDAFNFVRFLYDWILSHVALSDKHYKNCIIEYLLSHN
ncbi:MAG: bacteriohemerythrin [Treponemataceae bacterium]